MGSEADMGLGKQAKTLTKGQIEAVLGYIAKTRYPERNRVIFLLSLRARNKAAILLKSLDALKLTIDELTEATQIGEPDTLLSVRTC